MGARRRAGRDLRHLVVLVAAWSSGCRASFEAAPPGTRYPARDVPADCAWWHDAMLPMPPGIREIGTLTLGGASEYDSEAEVGKVAAEFGGDYWLRGGGRTLEVHVHERTGERVDTYHFNEYAVYRDLAKDGQETHSAPALVSAARGYLLEDAMRPGAPHGDLAVRLCERALRVDPDYAAAYRCRAEALLTMRSAGALERALADLERARVLEPRDVTVHRLLHEVGRAMGRTDLEGPALDAMIEHGYDLAYALDARARLRCEQGDLEGARVDLVAALEHVQADRPERAAERRAVALARGALVAARLGALEAARGALDQALELDRQGGRARRPRVGAWLHDRALLRLATGDREGARADLDAALDARHGRARVDRGLLRAEDGDLQGALEDLRRARSELRRAEVAAVALGVAHDLAGDRAAAEEAWAWALQPPAAAAGRVEGRAVRLALARYLATSDAPGRRDPTRALALAAEAVARGVEQAEAWDALAAVYAASGRLDEAAAAEAQALARCARALPHTRAAYEARLEALRRGEPLRLPPHAALCDPARAWSRDPWDERAE